MGGSGGSQGIIGLLRETNMVAAVPTNITPVESPPKNTSVVGG